MHYLVEFFRNLFQQFPNRKMLRTDTLTLAALDALRCFPVICGHDIIVVERRIPVVEDMFRIIR